MNLCFELENKESMQISNRWIDFGWQQLFYQGAQDIEKEMSQLNYQNSIPKTLQEKPFAMNHRQIPVQPVPLNTQTNKIVFNQPQTYPPQSVVQPKTYNYPHPHLQSSNSPKSTYQNPTVPLRNKATTQQTIKTTGLGSQQTVEKKFIPLSYEKVSINEQRMHKSGIDDKEYAKKTILTVFLGFFVLIAIVGVFYGIILYDKSRTPSESVVGNVANVNANGVKSVSGTSVDNSKVDLKLPENEASPLELLEHQLGGEDNIMRHQLEGQVMKIQSHFSYTHMRKHIQ